MTSLEERTDTNVRLSILLNCRKALLAVLLRSVEKEGRERQRERDSGERRGGGSALPSLMTAMLRPYALHPAPPQTLTPIPPIVPGPVPSTITAPVPAPDAADVTSVPVTPRPVSVPVTPRPTQAGTVPVPPVSLAVDPTPAPQTPTPVELDRAPSKTPADVGRDLVLFIRLMSFRGSPTYSTGLEFLSIDDVTAIGSQQKVITVDIILGRFLATILESDYHPERSVSTVVSSDIVTAPECSVNTTEGDERTFLTAVRTALLHTLITTVSGGKSALLNYTILYCTALYCTVHCIAMYSSPLLSFLSLPCNMSLSNYCSSCACVKSDPTTLSPLPVYLHLYEQGTYEAPMSLPTVRAAVGTDTATHTDIPVQVPLVYETLCGLMQWTRMRWMRNASRVAMSSTHCGQQTCCYTPLQPVRTVQYSTVQYGASSSFR